MRPPVLYIGSSTRQLEAGERRSGRRFFKALEWNKAKCFELKAEGFLWCLRAASSMLTLASKACLGHWKNYNGVLSSMLGSSLSGNNHRGANVRVKLLSWFIFRNTFLGSEVL